MGSSFKDTMGGLGHGLAGLVGAGSVYDPMGKLKTDLANANTEMQQTVNAGTITALQQVGDAESSMLSLIKNVQATMSQSIQLNNELIHQELGVENLFIACIAAAVVIIVFFMMWQKKCC
jgi:hypothetical protein